MLCLLNTGKSLTKKNKIKRLSLVNLLHENLAKASLTAPSDSRELGNERGEQWLDPRRPSLPTLTWLFGGDVDGGAGGAGAGRVVGPDCQVVEGIAPQVADFCGGLVPNRPDPFGVFLLLVVLPAPDLGGRAGLWQCPSVPVTNPDLLPGTAPAPCHSPCSLWGPAQLQCSLPRPGHGSTSREGSISSQIPHRKVEFLTT